MSISNTKELMHCHYDTNNRAPQWTFMDPCKPEVRPGAREESASPAWLAAPAMNARDTTKVYIWRLDTGWGPTLYRKCQRHNTQGKRHDTWVEPLAGNCCTTSSTRQREQVWQKCKIQSHCGTNNRAPRWTFTDPCKVQTRGETRCPGGVSVSCLASCTSHECPKHNESVYNGGLTLDVDRLYIGSVAAQPQHTRKKA